MSYVWTFAARVRPGSAFSSRSPKRWRTQLTLDSTDHSMGLRYAGRAAALGAADGPASTATTPARASMASNPRRRRQASMELRSRPEGMERDSPVAEAQIPLPWPQRAREASRRSRPYAPVPSIARICRYIHQEVGDEVDDIGAIQPGPVARVVQVADGCGPERGGRLIGEAGRDVGVAIAPQHEGGRGDLGQPSAGLREHLRRGAGVDAA